MRFVPAAEVAEATPYPALVEALAHGLTPDLETPERAIHQPAANGTLLTMPAWRRGRLIGVKVVTVYPDNAAGGALPSVQGLMLAFDAATGAPLAVLDGTELTNRRTAAVAALALRCFARRDSKTLLVIGAGALAQTLVVAHAALHAFERIAIWARDPGKTTKLCEALARQGVTCAPAADLEAAVRSADVIATATTARKAIVKADWVQPGKHLSLMGAFTKEMEEVEPALLARVRLFADTRASVLVKGGEVPRAIAAGHIAPGAIEADLLGLLQGAWPIERKPDDITLFKSVGSAAFDVVIAELALSRLGIWGGSP
jgi:ornithine cyclodeaminase